MLNVWPLMEDIYFKFILVMFLAITHLTTKQVLPVTITLGYPAEGKTCVWSPPVSATPPVYLCAAPTTPQLFISGLHQLINSPSNTPGFPAVIARLYFDPQW